MLKVGDKVKLNGCPFDEQIEGELLRYIKMKDKIQTVVHVEVPIEPGTSGQWITTNLMDGLWDKAWFKKVKK